jgi:response regulator of citrate/malate metabolism
MYISQPASAARLTEEINQFQDLQQCYQGFERAKQKKISIVLTGK